MSDEAAFLRAIQAAPTDATAKLVYADWLDEHGEPERAEYLRVLASGENDPIRMRELALRAGGSWSHSVSGTTANAPVWDAATLYALGQLDGTLEAYQAFNERVSDITVAFRAWLVPNTGSIEDLCRTHCTHG